jgi:hypothetical protein
VRKSIGGTRLNTFHLSIYSLQMSKSDLKSAQINAIAVKLEYFSGYQPEHSGNLIDVCGVLGT